MVARHRRGPRCPAQVTRPCHQRSDGIPLHVEELLAVTDALSPSPSAVPDTLADAVLSPGPAAAAAPTRRAGRGGRRASGGPLTSTC